MKISKYLILASLTGLLVSTVFAKNENDERDNRFQNPNVASSPELIDSRIQLPTGNTMPTMQPAVEPVPLVPVLDPTIMQNVYVRGSRIIWQPVVRIRGLVGAVSSESAAVSYSSR